MGTKHSNTNERSVWTWSETMRVGWRVHEKVCGPQKDYVEKYTLFGHIQWEYFGQPMNFSADPHISYFLPKYIFLNWSVLCINSHI